MHEQDVILALDDRLLFGLPEQSTRLTVIYGDTQSADDRIAELVSAHHPRPGRAVGRVPIA